MSTERGASARSGPPRVVFMFAGQGSQYFAMGRELYEHNPVFRDWMNYCSRRLAPALGLNLVDVLYGPRRDRFADFDQIRLTHPAVFSVNYCIAQTLLDEGIRPNALLGYSLGELVAWALAGILRLEDALEVVVEMAARIDEQTPPGAMLAVVGPPGLLAERPELFAHVTVGCLNFAGAFVLSGAPADIARLQEALRAGDIPHQLLPIRRAFHSPLLDPVEAELKEIVARRVLRPPELPVISAMLGRRLTEQDLTPQHCWDVVRAPVRFRATLRGLEAEGPATYIDCGPSGSLATFVRSIVGRGGASQAHAVVTPFGKDLNNLQRLRTGLGLNESARQWA